MNEMENEEAAKVFQKMDSHNYGKLSHEEIAARLSDLGYPESAIGSIIRLDNGTSRNFSALIFSICIL